MRMRRYYVKRLRDICTILPFAVRARGECGKVSMVYIDSREREMRLA